MAIFSEPPRFLLLNTIGKVVRHAREPLLRCATATALARATPPRTFFALKRPALPRFEAGP